jgi:hypothetical protein
MNKNAQISLEILAILGIVILGAVMVGVYYISNINSKLSSTSDIANPIDDFQNAFGDVIDPGYNPNGGDNPPNIDDPDQFYYFEDLEGYPLSYDPAFQNSNFEIELLADTNSSDILINNIDIYFLYDDPITGDYYGLTNYCNYNNLNYNSNYTNIVTDWVEDDDKYKTQLTFNCSEPGTYRFDVNGLLENVNNILAEDRTDPASNPNLYVQKEIIEGYDVVILSPLDEEVFIYDDSSILYKNFLAQVAQEYNSNYTCKWYAQRIEEYIDDGYTVFISKNKDDIFYFAQNNIDPGIIDDGFMIASGDCNVPINLNIYDKLSDNFGEYELYVSAENKTNPQDILYSNIQNFYYLNSDLLWLITFSPKDSQVINNYSNLNIRYLGDQDIDNTSIELTYDSDLTLDTLNFKEVVDNDLFYFAAGNTFTIYPELNAQGVVNLSFTTSTVDTYEFDFNLTDSLVDISHTEGYSFENIAPLDISFEILVDISHTEGYSFENIAPLDIIFEISLTENPNIPDITILEESFGESQGGLSNVNLEDIFYFDVGSVPDFNLFDNLKFVPNIQGGLQPYTCEWKVDDQIISNTCNPANYSFTNYSDIGDHTITLKVNDSYPQTPFKEYSLPININEPSFAVNILKPDSGDYILVNNQMIEFDSEIWAFDSTEQDFVVQTDLSDYECVWFIDDDEIENVDCDNESLLLNSITDEVGAHTITLAVQSNGEIKTDTVDIYVYDDPTIYNIYLPLADVYLMYGNTYEFKVSSDDDVYMPLPSFYDCEWKVNEVPFTNGCDTTFKILGWDFIEGDKTISVEITSDLLTDPFILEQQNTIVSNPLYNNVFIMSPEEYLIGNDVTVRFAAGGYSEDTNSGSLIDNENVICRWTYKDYYGDNNIFEGSSRNSCNVDTLETYLNLFNIPSSQVSINDVNLEVLDFGNLKTLDLSYYLSECSINDRCEFNGYCESNFEDSAFGTCSWKFINDNAVNLIKNTSFEQSLTNYSESRPSNLIRTGFSDFINNDVIEFSYIVGDNSNIKDPSYSSIDNTVYSGPFNSNASHVVSLGNIKSNDANWLSDGNPLYFMWYTSRISDQHQEDYDDYDNNYSLVYSLYSLIGCSGLLKDPVQELDNSLHNYFINNYQEVWAVGGDTIYDEINNRNKTFILFYSACGSRNDCGDRKTISILKSDFYYGNITNSQQDIPGLNNLQNNMISDFNHQGEYTYDYPSIYIDEDNDIIYIAGFRYTYDNATGSETWNNNDFNINTVEFYVIESDDYGDSWNLNRQSICSENCSSYIGSLMSLGNSLVLDNENKLHYAFSGTQIIRNVGGSLAMSRDMWGSYPAEIVYDIDSKTILQRAVYPVPGVGNTPLYLNSDLCLQKGYTENCFLISLESIVPDNFDWWYNDGSYSIPSIYNSISQQSINKNNGWLVQMWLSWTKKDCEPGTKRVSPNLMLAFSNDNGKNWSQPILVKSGYDSIIVYPQISPEIKNNGDGTGTFVIYYYDVQDLSLPSGGVYKYATITFDFENSFDNYLDIFDVVDYLDDYDKDSDTYCDDLTDIINQIVKYQNYDYFDLKDIFEGDNFVGDLQDAGFISYFYDTGPNSNYYEANDLIIQLQGSRNTQMSFLGRNNDYRPLQSISYDSLGSNDISFDTSSCFSEGTLISTPTGFRHIKDIDAGDYVYSYDLDLKKIVPTKVKNLLEHNSKNDMSSVKLYLSNMVEINVTLNHPFYSPNKKRYYQLNDFNIGDYLLYFNIETNKLENVQLLKKEIIDDLEISYNLSLDKPNNYFANGVLVHNYLFKGCYGYTCWPPADFVHLGSEHWGMQRSIMEWSLHRFLQQTTFPMSILIKIMAGNIGREIGTAYYFSDYTSFFFNDPSLLGPGMGFDGSEFIGTYEGPTIHGSGVYDIYVNHGPNGEVVSYEFYPVPPAGFP